MRSLLFGSLLSILFVIGAPPGAADYAPDGIASDRRLEKRLFKKWRFAQTCGWGWGLCPEGGCAPLGSN
jgi:hypothetical protein